MSTPISPIPPSKLEKYRAWLVEHGVEMLPPTNPFEVIRYKAGNDTHVIYRNDGNTRWTAVNGADEPFSAFRQGLRWKAREIHVGRRVRMSVKLYQALLHRDGDECFFCGKPVPYEEASNEHMVARSLGGPNHLSNYALAHQPCNLAAGNLSVVEKVRLRERMRQERAWQQAQKDLP